MQNLVLIFSLFLFSFSFLDLSGRRVRRCVRWFVSLEKKEEKKRKEIREERAETVGEGAKGGGGRLKAQK